MRASTMEGQNWSANGVLRAESRRLNQAPNYIKEMVERQPMHWVDVESYPSDSASESDDERSSRMVSISCWASWSRPYWMMNGK